MNEPIQSFTQEGEVEEADPMVVVGEPDPTVVAECSKVAGEVVGYQQTVARAH
jgi:hypothetical protein